MKKIGRQNPRPLLAWLLVLSLAFAGIPAKAAGAAPASLAQFQPADRAIFVGRPERAALPEGAPALQTHPLSGRVTNGSGNGIEGVTINAIPSHHQIFIPLVQSPTGSSQVSGWTADPRDSGPAPYSTQTDASGAYTFPALPAGTYRVWAEKAGFEFSPASRTVTLPHPAGLDYQILIQPPVIPPTTEVISPETNGHLVSISPDGSQFTFAQTTSELQGLAAGDIMVGAPTRAAPNGYLRRVTKVSTQGGKVIVETGPALLEEAVEDGSLYFQTTLNPADVVSAQALQGVELRQAGAATTFYYEVKDVTIYDNDKNPATKEDQVKANGSIEFELDYEFYLNINNGELQNLTLVEQTSVQDRLEIQSGVSLADLEEEKTLASLDFAPITLQIGEAPVVIAPRLEVVVGADGSVAVGMASSVEHDLTLQAGAGYAGLAGWQPVGEQSHKFTFTPPHATLEASVRGYYSPRLNLYLYGLAGPYVHLNPYLEFKVTPLATPWWVLDGGVDAPVGFKVSEELYGTDQYTGVKLEPYEVMALEIQEILATAQKENQAPYVPSSPAPVHESTNQPLDATLSWTGSDPDGDAVTYDVYLEAGDDSPDVRVSENQPVLTYNPGELQAGTTYYWQIVAKDEHGLSTAGPVWRFSTGEAAIPALPLASGLFHTCAVTETGDVQCWGANPWGQLGDGTNTDRYTPVAVTGLSSGVQALVAGWGHTCALTEAGGVKCWGDNGYGQLGDETNTDHWTPVRVAELSSGVVALAAGGWHTCALTAGGGVKCWGDNIDGQLGDGTNTDRNTPVDVVGLSSGVQALVAGAYHTCALTAGGGVKCWGWNGGGQLGDGTNTDRYTPVNVLGLTSEVQALAAGGGHTCALTLGGGVLCWGYNDFGQLGDGTSTNRKTPVNVLGLSNEVMALAAGGGHTCGVTAGGVQCWGDNDYGQLGDGTNTVRNTPVDVTGLSSGVLTLAAGGDHTCALSEVGGVQCWGNNQSGQLGDGTVPWKSTPVEVSGLSSGMAVLAAGGGHTCALTLGGEVQCWGGNGVGQLGDGTNTDRYTPVDVTGLSSEIQALAAGGGHTCVLTEAGGVKCWGDNGYGQLGDETNTDHWTPVDVTGLSGGVVALATGNNHNCALMAGGGVKCWGDNGAGQLGDGTNTDRNTPVDVVGLSSGVVALAAGAYHTCALMASGGIKCWGWNGGGQLGDGTNTVRNTPVDVVGLSSGVQALAAGGGHTCALTLGGGVLCWGYNDFGQLGDGTSTNRKTPVNVLGLSNEVMVLAAGDGYTCGVTAGGVQCWGDNDYGQLGDGTNTVRNTPVDVTGLSSGVLTLAAGGDHTCALSEVGGVQCWGNNQSGQLGDGTVPWKTTPVDVIGFGPPP